MTALTLKDYEVHRGRINTLGATSFSFLAEAEVKAVLKELSKSILTPAESVVGKRNVRQYFLETTLTQLDSFPSITAIKYRLERHLYQLFSFKGENPFIPPLSFNEVRVQRYPPGKVGIDPHRDKACFKNIVALLLLEGESNFFVYDDDRKNSEAIFTGIGGCIILGSKGFLGLSAQRIHGVCNIRIQRTTLGFRQKVLVENE